MKKQEIENYKYLKLWFLRYFEEEVYTAVVVSLIKTKRKTKIK